MSFVDFARQHGLQIDPSRFYAAERIFRCPTISKPRSDNGAYFWDGERGWVMDWAENPKPIWYNAPYAEPWNDKQKQEWFNRRKKADQDRKDQWERVAVEAEQKFRHARLDHHPYLTAKGFPDETGLVIEETLLVPMRNFVTNKVQGYQQIYWADGWTKKYVSGMRAKHAVLALGGSGDEIWLTEGYATALSVRAALRQAQVPATVICCFSANNLVEIANHLVKNNKTNGYVFADNDKAGIEAAERSFFPFCMAQEGWDANDLHQKEGLFAVAQKIIDLRAGYL